VIYLYAVVDELAGLPDGPGIDGASLERRRAGDFDLVVSEHAAEVEPTEEAVLAHARVVEELLRLAGAVLPARFGVGFEDGTSLERAVGDRAADLDKSLDRVRGRVEVGVRVVGDQTPPPAETGREYLEARQRQLAAIDELHDSLAARALAATRGNSRGQLVMSGAYLVDPDGIPEFQKAVGALQSEHPQLTFALTGPWPPYSFAEVGES
jgi:Gas vesicle synthesis protein GvpL/GvpF